MFGIENPFKKKPEESPVEQGGETMTAEQQAELQAERFASELVLAKKGEWDLSDSFFSNVYSRSFAPNAGEPDEPEQLAYAKQLIEQNDLVLQEWFEHERALIKVEKWDSDSSVFGGVNLAGDVEGSVLLRQKRKCYFKLISLQKDFEKTGIITDESEPDLSVF